MELIRYMKPVSVTFLFDGNLFDLDKVSAKYVLTVIKKQFGDNLEGIDLIVQ